MNKRKEEMHDFYFRGFGDRIKRKRKELNLTQESISRGICSNTYLSKIENNKVSANKEHLFFIMERVGLPTENIGLPEEMILVLQKSIKYFFYKDLTSYKQLIKEIEKYEFGILIFIARLGYYILIEDVKNATRLYHDMYRYLNALEDFGFSTFMIFGCYYNVMIKDYQTARMIIETVEDQIQNSEPLYGLYHHIKFIVYGQLHFFNKSRDYLQIALGIFQNHSNFKRLNEITTYKEIFYLYESCDTLTEFTTDRLEIVESNVQNYIICLKLINKASSLSLMDNLLEGQPDYLLGLFLKARYLFKENKIEKYKQLKKQINELVCQDKGALDYGHLLKLYEDNDLLYIKEYLINYVLPYFIKRQDIYLLKIITNEIVRILIEKKRYKDACSYMKKHEEIKHKLQFQKRIEL